MIITKQAFQEFIEAIRHEYDVYTPVKSTNGVDLNLTAYDAGKDWVISSYRTIDPLKILFYPPKDQLLPFAAGERKKRLIFGVKNCDLKALSILDHALLDDQNFTDLNYQKWREVTYIIGADCNDILPSCHCNLLGIKPYPELNCDMTMSEIAAGFYLEAKTPKGEELKTALQKYLSPSDTSVPTEIDQNRRQIGERLSTQNQKYSSYTFDCENKNNLDQSPWLNMATTCVECGGCCYICPTCYCILIKDVTVKPKEFRKIRTWDSCQHTGYAKVAGGGTPRPNLWQRFRHRYLCKFSNMVQNFSESGCTGCGRCVVTCPAKIDIRETVINSGQFTVSSEQ